LRSRTHHWLGGVASGLGEYVGVSVVVVRAIWVLAALVGLIGLQYVLLVLAVVAYAALWALVPQAKENPASA
jgi:phage shock protein PspC (stress-responsive transcriptional regulator)